MRWYFEKAHWFINQDRQINILLAQFASCPVCVVKYNNVNVAPAIAQCCPQGVAVCRWLVRWRCVSVPGLFLQPRRWAQLVPLIIAYTLLVSVKHILFVLLLFACGSFGFVHFTFSRQQAPELHLTSTKRH